MGYYVNSLQKGTLYELGGMRLEFVEKNGRSFYFYIYRFNEDIYGYEKANSMISYTSKELTYIRRIQECSPKGMLKCIGRDRVFAKQ
jgi:hypothetical protein